MSFLYPTYLYGLFLLLIPLIIHFFNFRRAQKVDFTNVRFLRTIKLAANARNKWRNLLILLMRMLFIVFLVLAFARPFLPKEDPSAIQSSENYVTVYVDNSPSMQNEADGLPLLDLAIQKAEQLTKVFPKNTLYRLITNNIAENTPFFYGAAKFLEKLRTLGFSNIDLSWEEVEQLQKAGFLGEKSDKKQQIFWISDFQRYPGEQIGRYRPAPLSRCYLLPLRPASRSNLFVDSLWLSAPFVRLRENTTLHLRLKNNGTEPYEAHPVVLYADDKQLGSTTVSVAPEESKELTLNFAVNEAGSKGCRITLDDYPMVFDNEYYFTLEVSPKIKIFRITAKMPSRYLSELYAGEDFFDLQNQRIDNLDFNALQNADLIILENLPELSNALQKSLQAALQKGTSLVVFPAADAEVSAYQTLLRLPFAHNDTHKKFVAAATPEVGNPFFEGVFEKIDPQMSMPEAVPLYRWGRAGQTLLNYKTGQTFLSLLNRGKGNIYLFSFPLAKLYSSLPRHALFVPLMYKIALASKAGQNRPAYDFSTPRLSIKLSALKPKDILAVSKPPTYFIPTQQIAGNQVHITMPKTYISPGNYALNRSETGETLQNLAFNYAKAESVLDYFSDEHLEKVSAENPQIELLRQTDTAALAAHFSDKQQLNRLWRYAILLALLCLLAETLLIRFWKTK